MKLLKENYEGLPEINSLSEYFKNFLSKPEVQEALQKADFGTLYKALPPVLASEFTELLNSLNINPLNYLDYIPIRFLANTSVKSIDIPDHILSISNYAFFGCSMLTRITIPNSVTSIGGYAFSGCSGLANVTIGNRVTDIGYMAFEGCRNLNYIKYMGTIDQWNRIHISSDWNGLSSIKTIHCLDGDIDL